MIRQAVPFQEALVFLTSKNPNPKEWDSAMWAQEAPAVRVRSFFSANVESARFLDRAQAAIFDYMAKTTEQVVGPDGVERTALRTGGRADFIRQMREFMVREGMATEAELWQTNQQDLTDIKSRARLELIFDTNVQQAHAYGKWRQGMIPAVRRGFPAARFVRLKTVGIPRPRHAAHENEVRLKTDTAWWAKYQNDPAIGGFGVPWGPYGFRSGMDQEDVPSDELEQAGIDPATVPPPNELPKTDEGKPFGLNSAVKASVRNMDPETKRRMLERMRSGINPPDVKRAAQEAAQRARGRVIQRELTDAEQRGDPDRADALRMELEEAMARGEAVRVVEEGDFIRLD
jgi:hypothetical protein